MFDRFAICEAYYAFASDWHGGQDCEIYRFFGRLERIKFKPRDSLNGFESLCDEGQFIYLALCEKYGLVGKMIRELNKEFLDSLN